MQEQVDAAIRKEPGVLVLYAVSDKDNPIQVLVFEIYRDRNAYEALIGSDHFKKYKATTEKMVTDRSHISRGRASSACPKENFDSRMYVSVEASKLTFPKGAVPFSLEG